MGRFDGVLRYLDVRPQVPAVTRVRKAAIAEGSEGSCR